MMAGGALIFAGRLMKKREKQGKEKK